MASTCVYSVKYADSSYSVGFLAKDKLRTNSVVTLDSFIFGCGQSNRALLAGAAGFLGLGRESFCLWSTLLGSTVRAPSLRWRQSRKRCHSPRCWTSTGEPRFMVLPQRASPSEGGDCSSRYLFSPILQPLSLPGQWSPDFPPTAYAAPRNAFRWGRADYPSALALSMLDTCYDMGKYSSVRILIQKRSVRWSRSVGDTVHRERLTSVPGVCGNQVWHRHPHLREHAAANVRGCLWYRGIKDWRFGQQMLDEPEILEVTSQAYKKYGLIFLC